MNGPDPEAAGGASEDSRDKWILIDRLCDAYEASLQEGKVERAPFLAGVPPGWRDQLSIELDAIDAAYRGMGDTRDDSLDSADDPDVFVGRVPLSDAVSQLVAIGSGKSSNEGVWLGRFEIHERIGTGATGSVWRARDHRLNRVVALKIPHATRAMSQTTAARFKTEARAAAAISHPNVVQVHEVLMEDGIPILVQQWIDGSSLAHCLGQSGPMDCERAAEWMRQIADAVACAHDRGIVHRDLKPANVMIDKDRPMVLDFGLASYPQFSSGLTTEGTMIGTPAYMSPEQAEGKESVTHPTSDIYSLGAMLYEMLVGQPPFTGKTSDVLKAVRGIMPKTPRSRRPDIPRDLEKIVLRCMSKSPSARYRSAAELRDDLHRYLNRVPVKARNNTLWEHSSLWYRSNPVRALLWITVPLVLSLGSGYVASRVEQYRLSGRAELLMHQRHNISQSHAKLIEHRNNLELARASQEFSYGDRKRGIDLLNGIPDSMRTWEWRLLQTLTTSPSIELAQVVPWSIAAPDPNDVTIDSLAYCHKQRALFAATSGGSVVRWDMPIEKEFWNRGAWESSASVIHQSERPIGAIAVSETHRLLSWVDDRGTVFLFDTKANKVIDRFDQRPRSPGLTIAFSDRGNRLAVGGGKPNGPNRNVKNLGWLAIFSVDSKHGLKLIDNQRTKDPTPISSVAFVRENQLVATRGSHNASTSVDGRVEFWRANPDGLHRQRSFWRGVNARGVDYSPRLNMVAWCDSLGLFYLYDIDSGKLVGRQRASSQALNRVKFSPNAERLYVTGRDELVNGWRLTVETPPPTLSPETDEESEQDASTDTPSQPQRIVPPAPIVNISFAERYFGHKRAPSDIAFVAYAKAPPESDTAKSANGNARLLVSSGDDGSVRLWKNPLSDSIDRLPIPRRRLADAKWLDDATIAYATASSVSRPELIRRSQSFDKFVIGAEQFQLGRVRSIDTTSKRNESSSTQATAESSPDASGRFIVCSDNRALLFHRDAPEPLAEVAVHDPETEVIQVAELLDDHRVLIGTTRRTPSEDLEGTPAEIIESHLYLVGDDGQSVIESRLLPGASAIRSVSQSPNGRWIAMATDSGQLVVFRCDRPNTESTRWFQQTFAMVNAHRGGIVDLAWLGNQPRLSTICEDGSCAIWNLSADKASPTTDSVEPLLEDRWQVNSQPLTTIASSIDGNRLLTAGVDNTIRIWDTENHQELLSLPPRNGRIRSIEFSRDGRFLMIAETKLIDILRLQGE